MLGYNSSASEFHNGCLHSDDQTDRCEVYIAIRLECANYTHHLQVFCRGVWTHWRSPASACDPWAAEPNSRDCWMSVWLASSRTTHCRCCCSPDSCHSTSEDPSSPAPAFCLSALQRQSYDIDSDTTYCEYKAAALASMHCLLIESALTTADWLTCTVSPDSAPLVNAFQHIPDGRARPPSRHRRRPAAADDTSIATSNCAAPLDRAL